jgi:ketosteroid isomerase-like protein
MRHVILASLIALATLPTAVQAQAPPDPAAVLAIDEAWQQAKTRADLSAMARIMADQFYEMNQNGNGRDKAAALALWATFRIESLTTGPRDVRVEGDAAAVTGTQTEVNGTGVDRMLFTRVYVRRGSEWRLLSSMQFRDPNVDAVAALPR